MSDKNEKGVIKTLTPNGWKTTKFVKFSYPKWIKYIPFRWLRIKIRRAIYDSKEAYYD